MKGLLIRTAAAAFGLSFILYTLACSPGSQNANQTANQNSTPEQQTVAVKTPEPTMFKGSDSDACSLKGESQRKAVEDRIRIKIWEDDELTQMHEPHPTKPAIGRILDFQVISRAQATIPHLQVKFVGQINRKEQFDDLVNKLEPFVKQGCVHKFSFYTKRPPDPGITMTRFGFEWSYCEYPMQACNDGECRESCGLDPEPTANVTANTSSNTNSNTNVNSNVNSNSNSNSGNKKP